MYISSIYGRSWPPLSYWHALCPRSTAALLNRPLTALASRQRTSACTPALPPRHPFRLVAMARTNRQTLLYFLTCIALISMKTDTNLSLCPLLGEFTAFK